MDILNGNEVVNYWRERVQSVKDRYKPGMRVRLLRMDDQQAPPIGTEGTIRGVDDIGSVMVAQDNGSGLNVVSGEDEIEVIQVLIAGLRRICRGIIQYLTLGLY